MEQSFWIVDPTGYAVDIVTGATAAQRRLDYVQRSTRIAHHLAPVETN